MLFAIAERIEDEKAQLNLLMFNIMLCIQVVPIIELSNVVLVWSP